MMIRGCIALSLGLLLLAGCRSHPEIPVSDEQSLVMESTLLAAGITAQEPTLTTSDIQPSASSTLYNERQEPVTVHYRFYWYDARRAGDAPSGSATQRDDTGAFVGHVVWQRQLSGGAQSQTLSLFVRGES